MKNNIYNILITILLSLIYCNKFIHCNYTTTIFNDKKDINNLQVQLNIISPQLSDVFHETNNRFVVAIELLEPDTFLPELTFICIIIHSIEKCAQVSKFDLEMISSGTFSIQINLKSYLDIEKYNSNEFVILSSINTIIDIANDYFLQSLIHGVDKDYNLLNSYLSVIKYEHLLLYQYKSYNNYYNENKIIPWKILASSSINNITTANQFIQQYQLHSQSFPMVYRDEIIDFNEIQQSHKIVLYLSNVNNILDSNRFKDWICDSDLFLMHGFTMTIITPSSSSTSSISKSFKDDLDFNNSKDSSSNSSDDDVVISQYCGVEIIRFEALSLSTSIHFNEYFDEIINMNTYNHPDYLVLNKLIMFLSNNNIDVLLLINTFGDPQTTLLLKCIQYLKTLVLIKEDKDGYTTTTTTTTTSRNQIPLVFMDLPNKDIPLEWYNMLDAFIAPSRAVGLDHLITKHGIMIGIIYPPLRDHMFINSSCNNITTNNTNIIRNNNNISNNNNENNNNSNHSDNNKVNNNTFHYIYIGRLAIEKSPGLLIRAINYIFQQSTSKNNNNSSSSCDISYHNNTSSCSNSSTSSCSSNSYISMDNNMMLNEYELIEFKNNIHITLAGEGVLQHSLQDYVHTLGLSNIFTFTGHVSQYHVKYLLQKSNVLINPKIRGETFGFVHIEAASQGIPVVAFDLSANQESIVNGILIPYQKHKVIHMLADGIIKAYLMYRKNMYSSTSSSTTTTNKLETCQRITNIHKYWNHHQHSLALIDMIKECLILKQ